MLDSAAWIVKTLRQAPLDDSLETGGIKLKAEPADDHTSLHCIALEFLARQKCAVRQMVPGQLWGVPVLRAALFLGRQHCIQKGQPVLVSVLSPLAADPRYRCLTSINFKIFV